MSRISFNALDVYYERISLTTFINSFTETLNYQTLQTLFIIVLVLMTKLHVNSF